jgi:RecA-family ATPase
MTTPKQKLNFSSAAFFYSAADWDNIDLTDDSIPLIGNETTKIIRFGTKNIVEAPEKSYKTTMLVRLMMGLSIGKTVYPQMPIPGPARVLYFHGEMTPAELAERRLAASRSIYGFTGHNYIEGRSVLAHFIREPGRVEIRKWCKHFKPTDGLPYVIVFDPWQQFISGFDENTFEALSQATDFLDKLIVEVGATLFIQMHQGKDPTKGARGHSSVAGWKDTTIRLQRKESELLVKVEPRWAEKFEFSLIFHEGTMKPRTISDLDSRIAKIVGAQNGLDQAALERALGCPTRKSPHYEATRKAIQRALEDKIIAKNPAGLYIIPFRWDPWDDET